MKCVILDKDSIDNGDIDFSKINEACTNIEEYPHTLPNQTAQRISDAEIVITNKVIIDKKHLQQSNKLKLICVAATGTNNVDIGCASKLGIAVCNVTGYASTSVVQHVFGLIITLSRNLHRYTEAVKNRRWQQSQHFCLLDYPIQDLYEKKLGIVGYGELGHAVAEAAKCFGMKILISQSLTGKKDADRIPFEELLSMADIISLHCPLTDESRDLINKNTLAKMKNTALLINTARGGIVNENDLWQALIRGQIAGAAVDVLSKEPPGSSVLIDKPLPNLIVTPHIAWASQKSRQQLVNEIALNIQAFKQGESRNRLDKP